MEETIAKIGLSIYFFWITIGAALFLLASMLFGDHGHDTDHDVGHDGDHSADHDGGGNMSIISARILLMFVAGYGVGGYIGARMGLNFWGSSGIGIVAGVILAAIGYFFLNMFYKRQGSSTIRMSDIVGQVGMVETTITPEGIGRIVCTVNGSREFFTAKTLTGNKIPVSTPIKITQVIGTIAMVEPLTKI